MLRNLNRLTSPTLFYSSRRAFTSIERQPDLDIQTFGNLAPWAISHLSSTTIPILIRHHEAQPYPVQRTLLSTTCNLPEDDQLDLTSHPTHAGLTFLFWLFHRQIPSEQESALPPSPSPNVQEGSFTPRQRKEHFTEGLIYSWALGSCVKAPRFQNDIMRLAAKRLHAAEIETVRSSDPHYSKAVCWAREAYEYPASVGVTDSNLRDFAVDVAAKRVYDVGMNGLTLSPEERKSLSTNSQFANEVFGSLGGQIGTKGVGVRDFARAYLVKEEGNE